MEISDLAVFKEVANSGSITRAAENLNRVPSNVTTRIQKLEDELGKALFIREKNRLKIAPAGKQLLEYANQILALAQAAKHQLQDSEPAGLLRIGSMDAVAATRIVEPLQQYHSRYPNVQLNVRSAPTGLLIEEVLQGNLDLALVADPAQDSRLGIQPMFDEELVLVSSLSHPAIKTPKDLGEQPTIIGFNPKCAYRNRLASWLKDGHCIPRVVEINSYHTMLSCVAAGMGICMVPKALLDTYTFSKSVQRHELSRKWSLTNTALIWRKDAFTPAMKAFAEILSPNVQAIA